MARRSVTKTRYFHGVFELDAESIGNLPVAEVEAREAGKMLQFADRSEYWAVQNGPRVAVGKRLEPKNLPWAERDFRLYRVERTVKFKAKPDAHKCDWRCLGARPGGECWCECGGRNHGREFVCVEIAA